MTETFKASNGWHVDEDGDLVRGNASLVLSEDGRRELRAYFQEKRDAELGRWRDTVEPDYVVYPRPAGLQGRRAALVLDESNGARRSTVEGSDIIGDFVSDSVARRYFQAHPARKPFPTEPGIYGHRTALMEDGSSSILELSKSGEWTWVDQYEDQTVIAQEWHDDGQLVRLAPVESEVGE